MLPIDVYSDELIHKGLPTACGDEGKKKSKQ